jgi:3-dehydroquinate synthase
MEQLTDFELSHADAVSVGVALDTLYSSRCGWLSEKDAWRAVEVLQRLQLPVWHESLEFRDEEGRRLVYRGLEEFREHLGGELTVLMLEGVGQGADRHSVDEPLHESCINELKEASQRGVPT